VHDQPYRVVPRSQDSKRIAGHLGSRRDFRQQSAVRTAELEFAVGLSIDLVALLVNGAMVPATEQGQIRERSGAPLSPVTDVMALHESHSAAREAAAAVSMLERPP
jgi:hypothetical protein